MEVLLKCKKSNALQNNWKLKNGTASSSGNVDNMNQKLFLLCTNENIETKRIQMKRMKAGINEAASWPRIRAGVS